MSEADSDSIVAGIDRHLSYLHKERWAIEHARLREVARTTTGEEQESARQAVQDHYATRDRPETSREALVEQAKANEAKRISG